MSTTTPPAPLVGRSRPRPRWVVAEPPDAQLVGRLASDLRLPDEVCRLLVARGHAAPDAAKEFLRPRLERLHPARLLMGLDAAVERLAAATRAGETVLVHGDYDVDGICSTTLLVRALRHLGANPVPFIPHRVRDGYDLTDAGVEAAIRAGARVMVTCDCGTSAHPAVAKLCAAGIDVIITDHHLPGGPVPQCLAVVNPKQPGCEYPDKDLAAVGLAFKLVGALAEHLGASPNVALHMLDLVALATIADIAPLRGENRVLARYGLKLLSESPNAGIRALVRSSGLEGKPLTAGRVGFILAPRLNAVGRLGHALRGVELLMCEDDAAANRIARELEELNRKRQELDRATLDQARRMLDRLDMDETFGIVLASEQWHPGVIGIVASRVVEETGRPAVLVALQDGEGKGSGRSIPALDLHATLGECRDLLLRFGGHRAAAGVTVAAGQVDAFARRFDEAARRRLSREDLVPELRVDLELPIDAVGEELESLLRHFEPFGMGNPSPVLASRGVRLSAAPRVVGSDGLKLCLRTPRGDMEAIGWGMGPRQSELSADSTIDLAYRLERDTYGGASRLVAKIADFRA